jgi:vitamin B12 transporter
MKIQSIFREGVTLTACLLSMSATSQTTEIEEILVTASLTPIALSRSGNAVTVISKDQIKNRAAINVSDLLRDVPGFSVSRVGVLGSQTQVRVRGAEANHLLVMIDGVEANDPSQSDEFNWSSMTASDIERIEIIRGPQSSLRGSDALAGVINIITRSAEKPSNLAFYSEVGSWSTNQSGLSLERKQGDFDFRFGLNHVESEGGNIARSGDEKDGYRNTTLTLKTGLKINEQMRVSFSARESDGMNQYDTDKDFDGLVEDREIAANEPKSEFDSSTMRLRGDFSSPDGFWQHKIMIARSTNDNIAFADGAQGNTTASTKDQYQYVGSVSFAEGAKTLSFLAERDEEDWMQRGELSYGSDPSQDRERDTNSLAIEYRMDINDRLTLAASGRHEDNSEFDSSKTFRGEAIYQLSDKMRVRGAFGTAVKNPTFTERFGYFTNFVGNPNLVPEESTSWEIGFDGRVTAGTLTLSATVFDAELENEINGFIYDYATYTATSGNIEGKSERQGVEISAAGNLSDSLSLSAAYTYTDSSEGDSVKEIRRPKNTASFNLGWQVAEKLFMNTNIQFTGDQTDTNFGAYDADAGAYKVVTMDSHTLINLNVNYKPSNKLEVYLKLENALDEDYEEVYGYQTLGFGSSVGLRYQL